MGGWFLHASRHAFCLLPHSRRLAGSLCCAVAQVYNVRQAKLDIDAVYSMGLFDDVNILPQPAEDSTLELPKVCALGCWRLGSNPFCHDSLYTLLAHQPTCTTDKCGAPLDDAVGMRGPPHAESA